MPIRKIKDLDPQSLKRLQLAYAEDSSVRETARRFGVSESGLRAYAKRRGWTRSAGPGRAAAKTEGGRWGEPSAGAIQVLSMANIRAILNAIEPQIPKAVQVLDLRLYADSLKAALDGLRKMIVLPERHQRETWVLRPGFAALRGLVEHLDSEDETRFFRLEDEAESVRFQLGLLENPAFAEVVAAFLPVDHRAGLPRAMGALRPHLRDRLQRAERQLAASGWADAWVCRESERGKNEDVRGLLLQIDHLSNAVAMRIPAFFELGLDPKDKKQLADANKVALAATEGARLVLEKLEVNKDESGGDPWRFDRLQWAGRLAENLLERLGCPAEHAIYDQALLALV